MKNKVFTTDSGQIYVTCLLLIIIILFICNLIFGSVSIPIRSVCNILLGNETEKSSWSFIILQSRLPQAFTALLCGAALSVSGLLLQTAFNNPLAGPSILGINTGASLGVALVMLVFGSSIGKAGLFSLSGSLAIITGASVGSGLILGTILCFSTLVKSNLMLLIIGIMIGYITSSAISLINLISILLVKPLNALLLGERYAANLGISIGRIRWILLFATGLLTATATAFCGPISFIGLAVPHISRLLLGSSNHTILLPVTLLMGAVVALLCNLICILPGENGLLPLNAITPILGAPVIIYVIINQQKIQYFH